jgi:hypothetical protein
MWKYKNNEINNIPEEQYGFVYLITNNITGEYYIGKKQFKSITNKKLGKKEAAALPVARGRKPTKKQIIQESNWKDYWSSSKVLQKQVKDLGEGNFTKEILEFAKDGRELTYLEVKYQFKYNVLEDSKSLNDSILGKFFKIP